MFEIPVNDDNFSDCIKKSSSFPDFLFHFLKKKNIYIHTYMYVYMLKYEEIMSCLVSVETSSWIEQIMYYFSQVITLLDN